MAFWVEIKSRMTQVSDMGGERRMLFTRIKCSAKSKKQAEALGRRIYKKIHPAKKNIIFIIDFTLLDVMVTPSKRHRPGDTKVISVHEAQGESTGSTWGRISKGGSNENLKWKQIATRIPVTQ